MLLPRYLTNNTRYVDRTLSQARYVRLSSQRFALTARSWGWDRWGPGVYTPSVSLAGITQGTDGDDRRRTAYSRETRERARWE